MTASLNAMLKCTDESCTVKGVHLRHGMTVDPSNKFRGRDRQWLDGYQEGYWDGADVGFRYHRDAALGALAIGLAFWMRRKQQLGADFPIAHWVELDLFTLWELASGNS